MDFSCYRNLCRFNYFLCVSILFANLMNIIFLVNIIDRKLSLICFR